LRGYLAKRAGDADERQRYAEEEALLCTIDVAPCPVESTRCRHVRLDDGDEDSSFWRRS